MVINPQHRHVRDKDGDKIKSSPSTQERAPTEVGNTVIGGPCELCDRVDGSYIGHDDDSNGDCSSGRHCILTLLIPLIILYPQDPLETKRGGGPGGT